MLVVCAGRAVAGELRVLVNFVSGDCVCRWFVCSGHIRVLMSCIYKYVSYTAGLCAFHVVISSLVSLGF
jgi:bacteriorhodopsin